MNKKLVTVVLSSCRNGIRTEDNFTGAELETARVIAAERQQRGFVVSLLVYTYTPTARKGRKCGVSVEKAGFSEIKRAVKSRQMLSPVAV